MKYKILLYVLVLSFKNCRFIGVYIVHIAVFYILLNLLLINTAFRCAGIDLSSLNEITIKYSIPGYKSWGIFCSTKDSGAFDAGATGGKISLERFPNVPQLVNSKKKHTNQPKTPENL